MSINNTAALADQPQAIQPNNIWSSEAPYLCTFYMFTVFIFFFFYCIFVACVIRNTKFRSSGFALLVSLMTAEQLVNLVGTLGGTLPITLHYAGMLNYTNTIGRYICVFSMASYFSACFNLIAISIQRYSAVAFYAKYQHMFTKRNTGILILVFWLAAFLISLVYMPSVGPIKFFFSVPHYGPVFDLSDDTSKLFGILKGTAFNGGVTGVLLILVCMFLRKLRQIRRTSKPISATTAQVGPVDGVELQAAQQQGSAQTTRVENDQKTLNDEIRLTIQVMIITSIWVATSISWFVINFILANLKIDLLAWKIIYSTQHVQYICTYGIDPLLILIMNQQLRLEALKMMGWKQNQIPDSIVINTGTTTDAHRSNDLHTVNDMPLVV